MKDVIEGASHNKIIRTVLREYPEARDKVAEAQSHVPFLKRQIWEDQGVVLYALTRPYNIPGAQILEIGTAWGFSAAVMALAAPYSRLTTLNPKKHEVERARVNLKDIGNIGVLETTSDDFFQDVGTYDLDMVFVDGQHTATAVYEDMRWFNHLRTGGLILFHDYSPTDSGRPVPAVFDTLNTIENSFRPFDVRVVDHLKIGVCGWRRMDGEIWNPNGG